MASNVWLLGWQRIDDILGHSMARVERLEDGWLCYGAEVLASPGETIACNFTVRLDRHWATREADISAVSQEGEKRLSLRANEVGHWWRDGDPIVELQGCVDIDVAATPLTNTFPINRFASLAVAEHRTTPVAWVNVPSLQVTRVEQTYRRLAPNRWEYSDQTHGAFELSIDDHGFVIDYEGFSSRVTE
jgi:uncharacterized protein